jgi:hypothetical protein
VEAEIVLRLAESTSPNGDQSLAGNDAKSKEATLRAVNWGSVSSLFRRSAARAISGASQNLSRGTDELASSSAVRSVNDPAVPAISSGTAASGAGRDILQFSRVRPRRAARTAPQSRQLETADVFWAVLRAAWSADPAITASPAMARLAPDRGGVVLASLSRSGGRVARQTNRHCRRICG